MTFQESRLRCWRGHPVLWLVESQWPSPTTAGRSDVPTDRTASTARDARTPRGLRVSANAPSGALPGCPGRIVLTIDRNNCGSWSTPCSLDLSLDCEAPGCWWSRNEWDGDVDAELFAVAASIHALDAAESEGEATDAD